MSKKIPQRKRIFVGCEGQSERAYSRWLQERADRLGAHLFFDGRNLSGGDPLSIVENGVKAAKKIERQKGPFAFKVILLDDDRLGQTPARDQRIVPLVRREHFKLIFQRHEHEALLLRHFPKCSRLRPGRGQGVTRLRQVWPDYSKPARFIDLEKRIGDHALVRVRKVETELDALLTDLGI